MNEDALQQLEVEELDVNDEQDGDQSVSNDTSEPEEQPVVTQTRFNKVYGRAMHAERMLKDMERQLEELKSQQQSQAKTEPRLADFDYDEDKFKEALMAHRVDEVIRKREIERTQESVKQQRDAEGQARISEYMERAQTYAKENPDYVALTAQAQEFHIEFPQAVAEIILESQNGPALQHHLLKNPQIIEELAALPPHKQGMKLAQIERNVQIKPKSKAPGIVPTVTDSQGGTRKSAKDMTPEEYYAWRMNQ